MISSNILLAIMMLCSQTILGKPISAATIDTENELFGETTLGDQQTTDKGNTNLYQYPQGSTTLLSKGVQCPPPAVVCEKAQKLEESTVTWKVCTTDLNSAICHPWARPGFQVLGSYSYDERPQKNLGIIGDYFTDLNAYCPQLDTDKDCAICATVYGSADCMDNDDGDI